MHIQAALQSLTSAFSRSTKNFGSIQHREPIQLEEPLALGATLNQYYASMSLDDDPMIGGAFHLRLNSLDELITALSGWLWVRDKSGEIVESTTWKRSWVIIADRDGDALFVDIDTAEATTYGSIQQRNFLVADRLADFIACLAECMILELDKYDEEVQDEDFNYIEAFLVDVRDIAENHLGKEASKGFMKFFFE